MDTGWVSSGGQWVTRFEQELCHRTGARYAVAVTNGTVALRLALHLAGVGIGDEVLLPPLSFVATANAIHHLGAFPHFIDIEPGTLGMCPDALSERLESIAEIRDSKLFNRLTGRRISAIVPVHVFGNPASITKLLSIANNWAVPLIEDAAEALGSTYQDIHCGLFGQLGILSFNGNKLITTGGGGAVITNSEALAVHAAIYPLRPLDHPWDFYHDSVAWNDRIPNINAALRLAQLEVLDQRLKSKITIIFVL